MNNINNQTIKDAKKTIEQALFDIETLKTSLNDVIYELVNTRDWNIEDSKNMYLFANANLYTKPVIFNKPFPIRDKFEFLIHQQKTNKHLELDEWLYNLFKDTVYLSPITENDFYTDMTKLTNDIKQNHPYDSNTELSILKFMHILEDIYNAHRQEL